MRSLLVVALVGTLGFLGGCGGGTPAGVAITISLSPSGSATVTAGQTLNIVATVSDNKGVNWTLSGVGSLSNQTTTSVTYNAPATVTNTSVATVTATSLSSSTVSTSLQITVQGITVSLKPNAPQTIDQGQILSITATVSNDPSSKGVSWSLSGVGTLSGQTTTSATYNAPSSVLSNSSVKITATSLANSSSTAALEITALPSGAGPNVAAISVNGGPVSGSNYINGAFTSVTVCVPTTSDCQTIDGILVDTGSFGLRVLASQLTLSLPMLVDSSGNQLNDCIQFLDGSFLWGTVASADIAIAGEVASATSIQTIETPTSYSIGSGCTGTNEDTQQTLGANGILGVGPEAFDCGFACDPNSGNTTPPPVYYLCSSTVPCQPTFVSCGVLCGDTTANQQVSNPGFNFSVDNNGVVLELPAVLDAAATADGIMVFGIGTQSNNGLGSATVFTLDSNDNFTTNFNGGALTTSFIDSGSNGLFFPDSSLTICPDTSSWYCLASSNLSATNVGANSATNTVIFNVDDFDTVTAAHPNDSAFSNVAGPNAGGFDWGLPFFYGRNVFTAINGTTVGTIPGPFWAY